MKIACGLVHKKCIGSLLNHACGKIIVEIMAIHGASLCGKVLRFDLLFTQAVGVSIQSLTSRWSG